MELQWPPRWWEFCLLSLAPENPSLSSTPHCWLCHTQLSLTAATKSSSVPLLPSKGAGRRQHPRLAGAKLQNHRAGLCPSHGAWAAPHSQAHGAWSEGSHPVIASKAQVAPAKSCTSSSPPSPLIKGHHKGQVQTWAGHTREMSAAPVLN